MPKLAYFSRCRAVPETSVLRSSQNRQSTSKLLHTSTKDSNAYPSTAALATTQQHYSGTSIILKSHSDPPLICLCIGCTPVECKGSHDPRHSTSQSDCQTDICYKASFLDEAYSSSV